MEFRVWGLGLLSFFAGLCNKDPAFGGHVPARPFKIVLRRIGTDSKHVYVCPACLSLGEDGEDVSMYVCIGGLWGMCTHAECA